MVRLGSGNRFAQNNWILEMKSIVAIRKCQDYEPSRLRPALEKAISESCDYKSLIKPGDTVLMKPNLLRSSNPEQAIVTHPMFVEMAGEILRDCGARLSITDSPPLGNLQRVLVKSGYGDLLRRLDIKPVPLLQKKMIEFGDNRIYKRLELASEAFDFDRMINLAKLKTHCQMTLSLAVKNLFGLVIGTDKASWHLRAGKVQDNFAHVLLQIYETVRPDISIIDGVLGMEGNGPNSGKPRKVGIIGASTDAIALDSVIGRLVGFPPDSVRTCVLGNDLGLGNADAHDMEVVGDDLSGFPLTDFEPPKSMSLAWNLSYWNPVRRFMENHIITKPRIDSDLCIKCGVCMRHCPPQAISDSSGKMVINRKACISCFCCHELCASDAISIKQPFMGRLLSRIDRKSVV